MGHGMIETIRWKNQGVVHKYYICELPRRAIHSPRGSSILQYRQFPEVASSIAHKQPRRQVFHPRASPYPRLASSGVTS